MMFWQPFGIIVWSIESSVGVAVMYTLYAAGWTLLVMSTFWISHLDLFGLRQVWCNLRGEPYSHLLFTHRAGYRFLRHPLYAGFLILIWSTPEMTVSHVGFAIAITVYILWAIPHEERDLTKFLPQYAGYMSRVPKLIPNLRRKNSPTGTDKLNVSR